MNPLLFDFDELKKTYIHEPNPSLELRRERILRILQLINENEENLCKALSADFGHRNLMESKFAEIAMIRQAIRFTLKNLKQWIKPVPVKVPFHLRPSKNYLIPESYGVVGIMSPWNYPLQLALVPAISALAAGNRVWLKLSERSPRTSGYLATLIGQYFHPTELSVICGGPEVSKNFAALPFDHLFFTGSTMTGKRVLQAAAENLTPVTLELGGKSPCIVDETANLADSAKRIIYGKLLNGGQTCVAPDYLLVPHSMVALMIGHLQKAAKAMFSAPQSLTFPIDNRQLEHWNLFMSNAIAKGAKPIPLFEDGQIADYPFKPHLLLNPSSESLIMREEIFAPILPIIGYETIDEAIGLINQYENPLAMYWFGKSNDKLEKLIAHTRSGGVTINDTMIQVMNEYLPFGGVGASGMGAYHGKTGFDAFTHYKPIFRTRGRFGIRSLGGTAIAHPPYGKKILRLIRLLNK